MLNSRLVRAAFALSPLVCLAAAGHADGYFYTYWKQRMPLPMEPGRVAVFRAADVEARDRTGLAVSLAMNQIDPITAESVSLAGWTYAGTSIALRGAADATEQTVARLAADESFDFVSPVFVNESGPVLLTRYVTVEFADGVTREQAQKILADANAGTVVDWNFAGFNGMVRVQIPTRNGFDTLAIANSLAARPDVKYAEPDMFASMSIELIPNDPLFPQQWHLRNTTTLGFDVGATTAWDTQLGSSTVRVAILDQGVQQNHPDINQVPGADFISTGTQGEPTNPCDNHGTCVAGCVSAIINNSIGVVGVAPNVKTMSLKIHQPSATTPPCSTNGFVTASGWANALSFAQSNGCRVTNASLGGGSPLAQVDSAYTTTYNAGLVHFASAGNSGASTISWPASSANVNGVAAMTISGSRASFSQFGPGLKFIAPGQGIITTDRTGADGYVTGDYTSIDGTSFASPITAGVAALVVSQFPAFSAPDIENQMYQTATRIGSGPYPNTGFGWGLPKANLAIQSLCAPSIGQNPAPTTVNSGSAATFTVLSGSGTPPFTYTWFFNGNPISNGGSYTGATTNQLSINPALRIHQGNYSCRISNGCGNATSQSSSLTILCPGDYTGDGQVNFSDLSAILAGFGTTYTFNDLSIVLSNFGRTC